MNKLYLGSKNPGKLAEYRAGLSLPNWTFPAVDVGEPEEIGESFGDIAEAKARYYAEAHNGFALAEDSGLVVPKLYGLPGVVSARFDDCEIDFESGEVLSIAKSGRKRDELDHANNMRLLEVMRDLEGEDRKAYYLAHLAVADRGGKILFSRTFGFHGAIAHEPRGENGFGYDYIFIPNDFDGRMASELTTEEKNSASHRGQGIAFLAEWLKGFTS
jgi:XTP/dITP diphosphohydrolase